MTQTVPALTGYRATSAELRRIADALDTLGEMPPGEKTPPWLSIGILPDTAAGVNEIARVVLGKDATTEQNGGSWSHGARGEAQVGTGSISVHTTVPGPDERDAELTALRARIAELEGSTDRPGGVVSADPTGLLYSRADDPRPVSPGRVPLQTGAVTDGGLVQETPCDPVTRYFSFGYGHRDPVTGEPLRDKYVTVIAADGEACRVAMLAKYGRAWAFEYMPGRPDTEEWIPRWTEHDRIDLTAAEPVSEARR